MKLPRDIGGEELAALLDKRVGTLNSILNDVASYLEMKKQELIEKLFR